MQFSPINATRRKKRYPFTILLLRCCNAVPCCCSRGGDVPDCTSPASMISAQTVRIYPEQYASKLPKNQGPNSTSQAAQHIAPKPAQQMRTIRTSPPPFVSDRPPSRPRAAAPRTAASARPARPLRALPTRPSACPSAPASGTRSTACATTGGAWLRWSAIAASAGAATVSARARRATVASDWRARCGRWRHGGGAGGG